MKQAKILFSLLVTTFVLGTGCQSLTSSRFESKVQVLKLAEPKTYEASFEITEGRGEAARVLATPKVIFRAGQPAKIEVGDGNRKIYADAYISDQGNDPVCLCKTSIWQDGKFIFRHSEIVTPKAK